MAVPMMYTLLILQLLLFYTVLVFGQSLNTTCSSCACCIDGECTNNICDHGCRRPHWGEHCSYDCPELCTQCSRGTGSCYYNKCTGGKYGSQCQINCPANCDTCSSSSNCYTCKDGYYKGRYKDISESISYNDCRYSCRENCTTCSTYNKCSECKTGYYGDMCSERQNISCSNCGCCAHGICTDNVTCDHGCSGLHWGDHCLNDCPQFCTQCSSTTGSCYFSKCTDGKYGNQCQYNCLANCDTCSSSSSCRTCDDGYYRGRYKDDPELDSYYDCRYDCRENCTKCSAFNKCSECKTGYFGDICTKAINKTCSKCNCCIDGICTREDENEACSRGCTDGHWGDECWYDCPELCTRCYKTNGNCYSGKCAAGYYGPLCDTACPTNCISCSYPSSCFTCNDGFYKGRYKDISSLPSYYDCRYRCHNNCTTCSKYASCTGCNSGTYGSLCQYACSSGCMSGTCSLVGTCSGGCRSGFAGSKCDQCTAGKFGTGCNMTCSATCKPNTCDRSSGACTECKLGYEGTTCSEEHPRNTTCNSCGCCIDKLCKETVEGICDHGCTNGHWGGSCLYNCPTTCSICSGKQNDDYGCNKCIDGYFGVNCRISCLSNCKSCTSSSSCSTCKDGFYSGRYKDLSTVPMYDDCRHSCPEECRVCSSYSSCAECNARFYGATCQNMCSAGCYNGVCDNSGNCKEGCRSGFSGSKCDTCVDGKYGDECNYNCSLTCSTSTCSKYDGSCLACKSGYTGEMCSKEHPRNTTCNSCGCCVDRLCKQTMESTSCDHGCIYGHWGDHCLYNCPAKCIICSGEQSNNDFGCSKCIYGYFGVNCSNSCLSNCKSCTSSSTCSTCKDGFYNGRYKGLSSLPYYDDCRHSCREECRVCSSYSSCDECKANFYGTTCQNMCPTGCNNDTCDDSGNCTEGCRSDFIGSKCDTCVAGKYGDECNYNCSLTCSTSTCSKSDGSCLACKSGYTGEMCSEEHVRNSTCKKCGCCVAGLCNDGGKCDHGCINGHWGDICLYNCPAKCEICSGEQNNNDFGCSKCIDGYFGLNCSSSCLSNCKSCTSSSSCSTCKDGFYNGRYGGLANVPYYDDCRFSCPEKCRVCSSYSSCEECKAKFYGTSCQNTCPTGCNNDTCDDSGNCKEGCKSGFIGSKCDTCVAGKYGDDCSYNCSLTCSTSACSKSDGSCLACKSGYTGEMCSEAEADSGRDDVTGDNGHVYAGVGGAVGVLVGLFVGAVCILAVRYMRSRRRQQTSTTSGVEFTNVVSPGQDNIAMDNVYMEISDQPIARCVHTIRKSNSEI